MRTPPTEKSLKFGRETETVANHIFTLAGYEKIWFNEDGEAFGRDFALYLPQLWFVEVEGRERGEDNYNMNMALTYGVHFRADTVENCVELDTPTLYFMLWDDWKTYHLVPMETIIRNGKKVEVKCKKRGKDWFYRMTHRLTYTGLYA